jgi:hypothetical protein
MALADQYTLSRDATFIKKCGMAMVVAATQVAAEDPAIPYHRERSVWATQVLRDPEYYSQRIAFGVASNAAITVSSTDNDIQFTVNAQWNAFSGVVAVAG